MKLTAPLPRAPSVGHAPTLCQQHHPRHDDERECQQLDDGEGCLQPGAPGDAPGVEGEDRVWRGDHTAAAHARHTQGKKISKYGNAPCPEDVTEGVQGERQQAGCFHSWVQHTRPTKALWPQTRQTLCNYT